MNDDMRRLIKIAEGIPFGGGERCPDCYGSGHYEGEDECPRCEGFGEIYPDDSFHSEFEMEEAAERVIEGFNIKARMADALSGLAGDDVIRDVIEKESRNVVAKISSMIPEGHPKEKAVRGAMAELYEYISSATSMVEFTKRCEEAPAKFLGPLMQKGVEEDCDETPMGGEDGECSPFTHADDNVDMVREEGDYHEEEVQRFMDMGKRDLWILYNQTFEEGNPEDHDALQYMEAALGRLGIGVAEGVMDEDFLIPPKDAKYDAEVEEEDYEDDDWKMQGGEDGLGPDGHGYDRDMSDTTPFSEQGPGDEFGVEDELVDVGDDEDYEEFDFDAEFDQMMGNTYRFDEKDVMEMNELRKSAGLPVKEAEDIPFEVGAEDDIVNNRRGKKIVTQAHIDAAGGEFRGPSSEYTGGPGTSTGHRGGDEVVITRMKTFPKMSEWWKEDPKDIMSMIYWQKDQLPPSDPEKFAANWEKVKANLTKKFGAGPVEESTDSEDDYVAFEFDDEKAYYLVADECGEMMEFGMRDECLIPDQWVDQVIALLTDHGFENGKEYSVAGMEEDLQNGYNDRAMTDGDDYFPQGATSSPARELGPAGAKHGDNPMRTPMASVDKEEEVYESYKQAYRRFRKA